MTAVDAAEGPAQVPAEARLSVLIRPGFTIVRLEGVLDIASTPVLRGRLLSVFSPGARLLIIDLSGVSFCDVSALAVLIGAQRRARGLGITVRLAALRPQMARLLRVTGLESHFTIRATLDDALPMQRGSPQTATSPPFQADRPDHDAVEEQRAGGADDALPIRTAGPRAAGARVPGLVRAFTSE